jgi:hypothetical protein
VIDYVAIAQKTMAVRAGEAGPASRAGQQQKTDPAEESWNEVRAHANALLNREGVRILDLEFGLAIGVWCDRDGPHIREALRVMGWEGVPVKYLDGDNVPNRYKDRDVDGEPVPIAVLRAMEAEVDAPWMIRDRMLAEMGWQPEGMTWEEWRMTTPVSSEEAPDPDVEGSASAPRERVDLVSPYAVNAINAVIHTQLDLYTEPDAMESLAPDEAQERERDRKAEL